MDIFMSGVSGKDTINFRAIAENLLAEAHSFVPGLFPAGKRFGHEYKVGSLKGEPGDSLSINLTSGKWADFSTGESGGDLISLYAAANGLRQSEAAKELSGEGYEVRGRVSSATSKDDAPRPPAEPPFQPTPYPADTFPNNDAVVAFKRGINHHRHGKPKAIYTYYNATGAIQYFICRFEFFNHKKNKQDKEFAGYSHGIWEGREGWHWKHWPDNRPLYNLPALYNEALEDPIIVVEGEKACVAAKNLDARHPVITWASGTNAWKKSDWSHVRGRKLTLWPDNDEPGIKAMNGLAHYLYTSGLVENPSDITIMQIPTDKPKGWDAADYWQEIQDNKVKPGFQLPAVPWEAPPATSSAPAPHADIYMDERLADTDPGEPPAHVLEDIPLPNDNSDMVVARSTPAFHDMRAKRPILSIANLKTLFSEFSPRVQVKYNAISKNIDFFIEGFEATIDNRDEKALGWICDRCSVVGMGTDHLERYLLNIADDNVYNPVITWIEEKPWDGLSRLQSFYDTVTSTNEPLKEILMLRWLISAIAALYLPNGVSAGGVLNFVGAQGLGKTHWFKRLVPEIMREYVQDGLNLNPADKDSVKLCISKWLVELGELDATFRKADIAALKAFLTRQRDTMRAPYGRTERTYARRTIFFGSVNHREYLHDATGNRRFWTVECTAINHNHTIEMQQLWAEAKVLFDSGEPWHLLPHEVEMLSGENENYRAYDTIEDKILTTYDFSQPCDRWLTASQILDEIGVKNPNKADATSVGIVVRRLNGNLFQRKLHGRYVAVPQKSEKHDTSANIGVMPKNHLYGDEF